MLYTSTGTTKVTIAGNTSGGAAYSHDETTDTYTREKNGGVATLSFGDALTLSEGTTYKLKMSLSHDGSGGYLVGLGNVALHGVAATPEPATATLSLLALAGLASRRRRK